MSKQKKGRWNSFGLPYSLINISNDALATQNNNVICFIDLKNKTSLQLNATSVPRGCGVSIMAGHSVLSVFAFAEQTLRPIIRVLNYPSFSVISQFDSPDITTYKDLCFSKGDHLIAQTSYPNFTIRVLNFRNNEILVELNTFNECEYGSLLCSYSYLPTISQYSKYHQKIFFYDLCYQAKGYTLPEISAIQIESDQSFSTKYNKCFAEDNTLYMVNDYGDLLKAAIGLFDVKVAWKMPTEKDELVERPKPRSYILQHGKYGMLIANTENIYFIKQVENVWQKEFKIRNIEFPILKVVSDLNGDLYMADSKSNLYYLDEVDEKRVLTPLRNDQFQVNEFAVLNGAREEAVLALTQEHELLLFDLARKKKLSEIKIDGIVSLSTHNSKTYAVVGNEKGELHFLSYVKIQEPYILASMDLDTPKITLIKTFNELVVVLDVFDTIIVIQANFETNLFYQIAHIDKPLEKMSIFDFFVINPNEIMILYTLEPDDYWPHANLMCTYGWSAKDNKLNVRYYELPFDYVSFTFSKDKKLELYAARSCDIIIDVFSIDMETGLWTFTDAIQTGHHSFVNTTTSSRNLITTSVSGIYMSFRTHAKSKKSFGVTKLLELKFVPNLPKLVRECFFSKYLVSLHQDKCLHIHNLKNLTLNLKENVFLPIPTELKILTITSEEEYPLRIYKYVKKVEPTASELSKQADLKERIRQISSEITELIEYDIEVAGVSKGMFRKFCLNLNWLYKLEEQADLLCNVEKDSILKATQDQARIRDWILRSIFARTQKLSNKVRALFTNVYCESYSNQIIDPSVKEQFDLFRFHDMEPPENELDELIRESHNEITAEEFEENLKKDKPRVLYEVRGENVFDHTNSEELYVQSKDEISYFQMHNTCAKFKVALNDPLVNEFNKYFNETVELKKQIIDNILSTNDVLKKIYSNMNIMRKLLIMEGFEPPELSVPVWTNDENLDRILTVDDSEIKAINRRKKKAEIQDAKSGRMLLWALEFWERALIIMMDGVLEKLWEEEIKKDIPVPEFTLKKEPHEFNITEQRQYREYLEKVRILELDRRKYLGILLNNEIKVQNMKKNFILKLNEQITQLAILKLKYDYTLKRCNLQLLNTKIVHNKRIQFGITLDLMKEDYAKISEYVNNYSKLCSCWERSIIDVKVKLESLQNRERSIERNFRSTFFNIISPQYIPEFRRLYRRCPKLNKHILSVLICDIIRKVLQQKSPLEFSIPQSANEFISGIDELDDVKYMPSTLEQRHWDQFVKLRRIKITNFLTVKTWSLRLVDVQNTYKRLMMNLNDLKTVRNLCINSMEKTRQDYKNLLKNRSLVLTLTLGQIEVMFSSNTRGFKNSILMHVDDVLEVNAKIKAAGIRKIRAMQRVALFRRQVIAKEWDHEITRANIKYLEYMLDAIEKTKVTKEFLEILYNWEKEYHSRKSSHAAVGIIENKIENKIKVATARLDRYIQKIEVTQVKINELKRMNQIQNNQIEKLKINQALTSVYLDNLAEEKRVRDQDIRMDKIKARHKLLETVRRDYAHILELRTILDIQRLRTYPNLAPAPYECPGAEGTILY